MYFPYPQTPETAYFMPRSMNLVIRTSGDPLRIANQVKAIVRSLDATVPVSDVRTLAQVVGVSVANRRFSTILLGAFAAVNRVVPNVGRDDIEAARREQRFKHADHCRAAVAIDFELERRFDLVNEENDFVGVTHRGRSRGAAGASLVARWCPRWSTPRRSRQLRQALAIVAVAASFVLARAPRPSARWTRCAAGSDVSVVCRRAASAPARPGQWDSHGHRSRFAERSRQPGRRGRSREAR